MDKSLSKLCLILLFIFLFFFLSSKTSAQSSNPFEVTSCSANPCGISYFTDQCQIADAVYLLAPWTTKLTGQQCCTMPQSQNGFGYQNCGPYSPPTGNTCYFDPVLGQQTYSGFYCYNNAPTPTLPPPPTPTPTITPCSSFTSCDTCIFAVNNGGPNNCGWNGGSCEAGTASCPFGYSQWYWTTCAINECPVPTTPPTPTPTPTPGQCQQNSDCGTPANSCTTVYCLGAPNGVCVYNSAPAGTVCDTNGSVCDGNGICLVPTPTPSPIPCLVTTSPSVHNLTVGGTGTVTSSVTSGQGSATINQMRFGSYDTTIATVNPISDSTSIYSTTVTANAGGATAVWGTADLSDGRTCQSSGTTDTDINVSIPCPPGTTYTITGTVTGQPSGKKLTVCRDPNTPGSCVNAASSTTTNPANGSYTLSNISSDTYHLIYLDPASLPVNYSVSSTNPVNVSSNTCPATVNFTVGTGPTPTPTPPLAGPTATPAPPTPTSGPPPPSCNYVDPPANSPTVTLEQNGHTLDITYFSSGTTNTTSINLFRNTTPGFLASTPPPPSPLFSTQFGNQGFTFHTDPQYPAQGGSGYANYYNYQLVKTSSEGTSYSNSSSVAVRKPNVAPCNQSSFTSQSVLHSVSYDSSSEILTIQYDASYAGIVPHGGCGTTCQPTLVPQYIKIQRASGSTAYIPWNSISSPRTSECVFWDWFSLWYGCSTTRWTANYLVSLPPSTSDTFNVTTYEGSACSYTNLTTSPPGSNIATNPFTTQADQAPVPSIPALTAVQPSVECGDGGSCGVNYVSLGWTPTQDGVDVQAYYTQGATSRWTLGTPLTSTTPVYNGSAWVSTATDNLNLLLPGTYYYGAQVNYDFSCGPVQTDQTAYDWTGKFYTVSGNVFVDTNKNRLKDPGEQNYTGPITISSSTGTITYPGTGNFKIEDLPENTYTISYTSLPTGYQISYPVNGPPPSFDITVGTACSVGSSNSAACIGQGDIKDLNFGITNLIPWIQSVGLDLRIDSGFNDYIPSSALQPYASILGTGGSPGIIFSGANSYDFGQGQASPNPYSWIVGGFTYPEIFVPKQLDVIQTSYTYQIDTADKNGLTPTDMETFCTGGIGSCILSSTLPHGLYIANGDLTIDNLAYSFGSDQDYIILVSGDLTLNGNISVPNGSTVTFSVSGNIYVAKSVTNIQGYYSADGNFVVQGTNNCSIASDVQLKVEGSVVVNAGLGSATFQNQRDLCANNTTTPSVQFIERPDFIINSPQLIHFGSPIWKEVAP